MRGAGNREFVVHSESPIYGAFGYSLELKCIYKSVITMVTLLPIC